MNTDLSVENWLSGLTDMERKALKIAEELLGECCNLSKCNGYLKWIQQHKIMNEYNEFKHKASSIELMKSYNSEYDFYDKTAEYVIFAEYYAYDDNEELNPIHFEYCNEGNADFKKWLDKHKLRFEWFNSCVGIVYKNKEK